MPLLAIAALAAFACSERLARHPLIHWRPLRTPTFAAPIGINAILHATMMGGMFVGPLLVARELQLGAAAAGGFLLTVQGAAAGAAPVGGWLRDRGQRALRPTAAAVMALGIFLWAPAGSALSYPALLVASLIAGAGMGLLLASNNAAIMGTLPEDQRGVASGILETTRQVGHMLGVVAPVVLLGLAAEGGTAGAVRIGFVWSTLVMGAVALGSAALALVPEHHTG